VISLPPLAETALITGASSGIGEEFARQLAERGYDLVLVARRKDRLQQLAEELPTTAAVIECDLATEADKLFGKVRRRQLEVDLLVNNAGFGTRGRFTDIEPKRDAELVRLNCEAVVTLTHAFLPGMIERGHGGVITVASTAGMQPLPYEATYGASKAFAINFTEAVGAELHDTGVKTLAVNPGPVKTEWQAVAGYDENTRIMPGIITAEKCVRDSLRAWDRGRRSVIPGRLFPWVMRFSKAPKPIKIRIAERIYRPDSESPASK
jgi:short-subunit dehydrogenase